jgi:hypothetical protein
MSVTGRTRRASGSDNSSASCSVFTARPQPRPVDLDGVATSLRRDANIAFKHSAGRGHHARLDGLVTLSFFEHHGGLRIYGGGILA